MALSQTELVKKTKTLTLNGLQPEIQAVIGPLGYNAAGLSVGAGYAATVETGDAETQAQKALQTRFTRQEKTLRAAAQTLATQLAETARILYKDDPDTLLALGLQTQYETVIDPDTGETKRVAARASITTADVISRWNTMFTNASLLTGVPQTLLTGVGWNADKLSAALDAVEAYSNADTAQQAAIADNQARSAQFKKDVATLRQWYSKASGLCKIALKAADPQNEKQGLEMLGLV